MKRNNQRDGMRTLKGETNMSDIRRFIKEEMKRDPEFKKAREENAAIWQVVRQIIKLRKENGWTQAELARRLGTTQSFISRLENGENISLEYLDHLARSVGRKVKIDLVKADEEAAAAI